MSTRHVPNVLDPFASPYLTHEQRAELAAGYRKFADWIETTNFPIPSTVLFAELGMRVPSAWIEDESFVQRPASAAKLIGGLVEKGLDYGQDFKLTRDFGGGVYFKFVIKRDAVCTPRQETTYEERLVPIDYQKAQDLQDDIREAQEKLSMLDHAIKTVPVERTVYDCPPSLAQAEATS